MFIDNLTKLMEERKITEYKLAKDIGITQSVITRWKQGSYPGIDKIEKLVDYFQVSSDLLIFGLEKKDDLPEDQKQLIENYKKCNKEIQQSISSLAAAGAVASETVATGEKTGNGNLYSSKTG